MFHYLFYFLFIEKILSSFLHRNISLILLLSTFFYINSLQSQNHFIYLGKKGNVLWNKKIHASNLGHPFTYYYPIYYKTSQSRKYSKTGIFGKSIKPELRLNIPEVIKSTKKIKEGVMCS